jgi:hypothetical protein
MGTTEKLTARKGGIVGGAGGAGGAGDMLTSRRCTTRSELFQTRKDQFLKASKVRNTHSIYWFTRFRFHSSPRSNNVSNNESNNT